MQLIIMPFPHKTHKKNVFFIFNFLLFFSVLFLFTLSHFVKICQISNELCSFENNFNNKVQAGLAWPTTHRQEMGISLMKTFQIIGNYVTLVSRIIARDPKRGFCHFIPLVFIIVPLLHFQFFTQYRGGERFRVIKALRELSKTLFICITSI